MAKSENTKVGLPLSKAVRLSEADLQYVHRLGEKAQQIARDNDVPEAWVHGVIFRCLFWDEMNFWGKLLVVAAQTLNGNIFRLFLSLGIYRTNLIRGFRKLDPTRENIH